MPHTTTPLTLKPILFREPETDWQTYTDKIGTWLTINEKNVTWYGQLKYLNFTKCTITLCTKMCGKYGYVILKMEDTISIKINWLK